MLYSLRICRSVKESGVCCGGPNSGSLSLCFEKCRQHLLSFVSVPFFTIFDLYVEIDPSLFFSYYLCWLHVYLYNNEYKDKKNLFCART